MTLTQPQHSPSRALPGLRAARAQRLPFAPSLEIRAFVLEREAGNLLVYSVDGLADEPVERQYLNHAHEAMFGAGEAGAPVFLHAADAEAVPARATFSRRHRFGDDFEVIPTPGHTPGATAYLWESGRHRYLFTGDTVYLRDGEWVAAVLDSSDRAAYVESLDLLRGLDFDVLVPWAASVGGPWFATTDPSDAHRRIGAIIDGIWRRA